MVDLLKSYDVVGKTNKPTNQKQLQFGGECLNLSVSCS